MSSCLRKLKSYIVKHNAIMRTFKSGINLKKHPSSPVDIPLSYSALPTLARVSLLQHSGAPAIPVVNVGDKITEGQLIAEKDGNNSARVHSPVPGVVKAFVDVTLPNGQNTKAIEIETGGLFRKNRQTLSRSLDSFNRARLLGELADRGVVDHNFSAVPTQLKYNRESSVHYVVIALSDSDPYSAIQEQILREHSQGVIDGLMVLSKLLEPQVVILCASAQDQHLISEFIDTLGGKIVNIQPLIVPNTYPFASDEMIKIQLHNQTKSLYQGSSSCVVVRPSLLYQLQQSVLFGMPCIDRPITIAGGALARPANMFVRSGTPIRFLLEECGGFRYPPARIIVGTQQSGFAVTDLDIPVGKDTSMILALTRAEISGFSRAECNNCGLCDTVCPVGIIPSEAHKAVLTKNVSLIRKYLLENCLTCGACSYVCPSHIPLNIILTEGKKIAEENLEEVSVTEYKP